MKTKPLHNITERRSDRVLRARCQAKEHLMASAGGHATAVAVGTLAIAERRGRLIAEALGPGVAVCAWDRRVQVGGVVNILLPSSGLDPVRAFETPALFADRGVDQLITKLVEYGASPDRITVHLVGGATPTADSDAHAFGSRNVKAVRRRLRQLSIPVVGETVGGARSHTVCFDVEHGETEIWRHHAH